MINENEIIKERIKYYYDDYNLYKLTQICKNREIAILDYTTPFFLRGNWVSNEYALLKFLKMFNVATNINRNLYITSATFSSMPNMKFRNKDVSRTDYFFNYLKDKIIKYDLLIDFDVKKENDRTNVLNEFINFKDELTKRQINFYSLNSGNGYHCVLTGLKFPFEFDGETLILYKKYGERIREDFKLKYYDLKNLGVWNRLQKMPYSLVKNKICNIIEV